MNPFSKVLTRLAPLLLAVVAAAGCVSPAGETPDEQRADIRAMREESLQQAYEKWPELKNDIAKAPGYAVMNNGICKILLIGTAKGYGVVTDSTGQETFVNDFAIALGPGIELASSRGIFVFHDAVAMKAFCDGQWDFGADADAAFKFGDFGGALTTHSVGDVVDTHRVFQNGVGLHASVFWLHSGIDEDYNGTPAPAAQ
jgi:lipid-binding SYLF domain-containing protein